MSGPPRPPPGGRGPRAGLAASLGRTSRAPLARARPKPLVIAEPHDDFRDALVDVLARHGIPAVGASSVRGACAVARSRAVDAVYAHVHLPSEGGLALLRTLAWEIAPAPVGILAGLDGADREAIGIARGLGIHALDHRFRLEDLLACVRGGLRMRSR